MNKGRGQKKKLWKSGQADRLGWPPPPLPRSGQENVKISRQVAIFGVILSFYKGQKWVKIFTNRSRLQRWSFFCNDGMVMFFFQGTIAIDGFSMVLPALDHHHWMFFYWSTIDIDGFPMVFPNSGAMVSNGFNLERDLKMRVIVSASIFNSSDQQVLSWIF